nr:MAG TPA: hypothetical protein [Bacteriophage sp.]
MSYLMLIFYRKSVFFSIFIVFAICIANLIAKNRPHFCLRYD